MGWADKEGNRLEELNSSKVDVAGGQPGGRGGKEVPGRADSSSYRLCKGERRQGRGSRHNKKEEIYDMD